MFETFVLENISLSHGIILCNARVVRQFSYFSAKKSLEYENT
jgi:hypothetical protein